MATKQANQTTKQTTKQAAATVPAPATPATLVPASMAMVGAVGSVPLPLALGAANSAAKQAALWGVAAGNTMPPASTQCRQGAGQPTSKAGPRQAQQLAALAALAALGGTPTLGAMAAWCQANYPKGSQGHVAMAQGNARCHFSRGILQPVGFAQ